MKLPRKIVHIIGQLIPGGVEMRTLELIEASNNDELQHYVVVTSGREGSLDDSYRKAGAQLVYHDIKSLSFPLFFYRFLRTHTIDVVHSYIMHSSGYILAIARLAGVAKRIVHFRSDGQKRSELRMKERFIRGVKSSFIDANATVIAGLTPANLEIAWKPAWRNDPRCMILPNGIVVKDFAELSPPAALTQKPKRGNKIFLHVGRGELPSKNRDKAIKVLAAYNATYGVDEAQLVFLGRDGRTPEEATKNRSRWNTIAMQHSVLEHITYAGEHNDVAAWMVASDVLIFTSTLEGLPGAVLEARSTGLPIVSTNLPGVEFIAETFPDIRLLDAEAPDNEWADAIQKAMAESPTGRLEKQSQFRGSPYDFDVTFRAYKQLWAT